MKFLPKNKRGLSRTNVRGQALLLVLLSMAVVLVVVLSVLSRSITDIRVTSGEESSMRAFSAAEAGVEQVLVTGLPILTPVTIGDATFTTGVTSFAEGGTEFVFPSNVSAGDSVTLWFVSHASDGSLTCPCFTGNSLKVCWGAVGTLPNLPTTPAVEVSIVYTSTAGDYSSAKIARAAIDPRGRNSFDTPGLAPGTCTIGNQSFAFQKDLDFNNFSPIPNYGTPNVLQFAILRILYNTDNAQPIGVSVRGGVLPSQGILIDSQGVAGESNRRVEVFQGYPELPFIFNNAVFSPGGLTK